MMPEEFRVSVKLKKDCETERFLHTLETLLERPVRPVRVLKSARVLSLRITKAELEQITALPEVLGTQPEGRAELPPKPFFSRK